MSASRAEWADACIGRRRDRKPVRVFFVRSQVLTKEKKRERGWLVECVSSVSRAPRLVRCSLVGRGTTALQVVSMAYQTPDTKKEEFRKYLEKAGVIDALTRVLVALYEEPEKPANPLDFIKQYLGSPSSATSAGEAESLRTENDALKKRIEELTASLKDAKVRRVCGPSVGCRRSLRRWRLRCIGATYCNCRRLCVSLRSRRRQLPRNKAAGPALVTVPLIVSRVFT